MFWNLFFQAMKQRDEDLAREIELLKQKLEELEHLARARGLTGLFEFRHAHATDNSKIVPSWLL